jgi:hypothetical protein
MPDDNQLAGTGLNGPFGSLAPALRLLHVYFPKAGFELSEP